MKSNSLKLFCLTLSASILSQNLKAQSSIDIGKFGQTASFATARSVGFGGALGSVGGDFASLSVNPAGIGIYRSSEFMVTPGFRFSGSKSNYSGSTYDDNNARFGFNNIGMVFTGTPSAKNYDKSDWKSGSFGIGINRVADFSRTYNYMGKTNSSTGSFLFEQDALNDTTSIQREGSLGYLGYQSYLLDNNLFSLVPFWKGLDQFNTVQEKGGITEFVISGGGNYKDKLMVGATLGINSLNHRINSTFSEQTTTIDPSDSFDNYSYNQNIKVNGAGINLKLGAIYKFNDYFRAGFSFHSPTLYSLTEVYNADIKTNSDKLSGITAVIQPENQFDYTVITPLKLVASATGMLGKYGFVSLDYEYVNYSGMRFRYDPAFIVEERYINADVKALYQNASNIRAGLELKFDQLLLRAGYGYYGSPYKNKLYQSDRNNISFGVGYRFGKTFVDIGVINSAYTTLEKPYEIQNWPGYTAAPTATIKNNLTTGVFTVGWKF